MKVPWGSKEYVVVEEPTPHIVIDALESKPTIPGRWGLKSDTVPKACTMDVLHLAPYKGCTVGCAFCSLPQYRGYNLLYNKHGVSVVLENYDLHLEQQLKSARIVHTFDFGADADVFMAVNDRYKVTQKTMQVLNKFKAPFTVTSKCRFPDDAIELIAEQPESWAQISVVTLDDETVALLKDNMKRLKAAGVKVTARVQPYVLGVSPNITDMLGVIKAFKFDQVVFGLLRAPMGKGRKLLDLYNQDNEYDLNKIYHEKYPGYWQMDNKLQRAILAEAKEACADLGLKLGLCDVYEKQKDDSILSLQPEYGTCKSCECVNGYAYVKAPGAEVFTKVKGCPGNCLLCVENPPCGVPEFSASVVSNLSGYQRLVKKNQNKEKSNG